MKIYLIGMPGSGKSTLGKRLAEELELPFVDLDSEIENHEHRSVQQIFAERGEDHFRQVESQLLREWAGAEKSFVMATGGGAPCFLQGIEVINQTGLSVFLDVPVRELLRRVARDKNRPLLQADELSDKEARLKTLHAGRLKYYQQAHVVIDRPDVKKVLKAIRLRM